MLDSHSNYCMDIRICSETDIMYVIITFIGIVSTSFSISIIFIKFVWECASLGELFSLLSPCKQYQFNKFQCSY